MTIFSDGTLSIYADSNTEPFLEYQHTNPSDLTYISFETQGKNNDDVVGFVDCSVKYKPNCGVHLVEKLYGEESKIKFILMKINSTAGCREWFVEEQTEIIDFEGFRKTYGKDVIFDEFIVVDADYGWSAMEFNFVQHVLTIGKQVYTT